jgi:predicted transcriptional regulator
MSLAENIAYAVERLGGQTAVAALLDCTQAAVSDWVHGHKEPREKYIEALAAKVPCHAADLRYGDLKLIMENRR